VKFILSLLAIFTWLTATYAQEVTNKHSSSWNTFTITSDINAQYAIKSEFHFRRTNFSADWEQFVLRPSIHYKLNKTLTIAFGYSFIENFSYSNFSTPIDATEHNIWQQLIIKQPFKKFGLTHRIRFEERFMANIIQQTEQFSTDGYNYQNRLRYRFITTIPLISFTQQQQLNLIAYDEVFLNFEKGLLPKSFPQNWIFLGLGFQINSKTQIKSGYHDIYVNKNNHTHIINHIWETTVTYKI